ncbi:YcnI family copper-binding membrane protein [Comamonas flocculans]|uniref:YcnI family protein n=1 Tax=Comamonas flocculans TaxID=2597701 RepID=A0A5B8RV62_9BURK|nr:YcnI family protein [Comamonas flocculans]QEA12648.1 YcnI family protein [Comamonas flocculans]
MSLPTIRTAALAAPSLLAGALLCASTAQAHVTLQTPQAQAGSGYKAVLRLPHGCKGSATVRVSVQIPAGVIAVKPQPKPGWQIEIQRGKYAQAYRYHGAQLSEGVRTLTWSGGPLPDAYYDEFVFSSQIASSLPPGTVLYFPVVQTCEQGVQRWIEIPADGQAARPEMPAPALKVTGGEGQ